MSNKLKTIGDEMHKLNWLDAEPDDLHAGYVENLSQYRACRDDNNEWVVEATRVKIIARASDEQEAKRIADALNQAEPQDHN